MHLSNKQWQDQSNFQYYIHNDYDITSGLMSTLAIEFEGTLETKKQSWYLMSFCNLTICRARQ